MQVQSAISAQRLAAKVGRTLEVLVDEVRGATAIGRSAADAPEIDGLVRVKGAKGAKPGDFIRARVTAALEHDLEAKRAA
jgi:ribosomal protein S12 methylthiotransferase